MNNRNSVKVNFWANVLDYGAKPEYGYDSSPGIQRAVDVLSERIATAKAADPSFRTKAVVIIPARQTSYYLKSPIWVDSPFIHIKGEGQGTRLATFPNTAHPHFIFGLRRKATIRVDDQDIVLKADAKYRPDLFNKLDSSVAPTAGTRWGFRTHGETFIQAQACPLSAGPRSKRMDFTTDEWAETTQLTIELAVEGPNGGPMIAGTPICGTGLVTNGEAYPFVIYMEEDNRYRVVFATQTKAFGPRELRIFAFSSGNATGVQRISIQIDLETHSVTAYVNATQVQTFDSLGREWGTSELRFNENHFFPFLIGDAGGARPQFGVINGYDFSLYGLLLSRSIRYENHGIGEPQLRTDGSHGIGDYYRYFTPLLEDAGTIGYFGFQEDPVKESRVLTIVGGPASNERHCAAFLFHALQTTLGGIIDCGISDLHLVGGHIYGQNIAVGQVLDFSAIGVRSTDGYHGIGSLNNGANYNIRVEQCVLDGSDSGYYGLDQNVWIRDVTFAGAGRSTLRFAGCSVNATNIFVAFASFNSQSTVKMHSCDYGGNYAFQNVIVDYEGGEYAHTAFYCESHQFTAGPSLRLHDIYLGTTGHVPLIVLNDVRSDFPKSTLMVDNLQVYTTECRSILNLNGPNWYGDIKNIAVGAIPRIEHSGEMGTHGNVVIHEVRDALPTSGYWHEGCHAIEIRPTQAGGFTEWRCGITGEYGTSSPPSWYGINRRGTTIDPPSGPE